MRWRSVFSGALALAAFQAVTSSMDASNRAGGLIRGSAAIARHFLSPFEPAIPDLRKTKAKPPPPPPPPGPVPGRPVVPVPPGGIKA